MNLDIKLLQVSGPTYAPSHTLDYLRCPRLSQYAREWEPAGEWMEWVPNLLVGQAIHAGIAWELNGGVAVLEAVQVLAKGWPHEIPGFEAAQDLMVKGLKKALGQDLLGGGRLVAVEECLDHEHMATAEDGSSSYDPIPGVCAIADMIHETIHGELSVTDHKSKLVLDSKWINRQIRDTETSWQLFDYARRASLKYNRWVTEIRQHLVVCSPVARSVIETVAITPERLIQWTRSAEEVWGRMYDDELGAGWDWAYPMNWTSCWDFTRNEDGAPPGCPYFDGCHRLLGDTTKFATIYQRRERN